MDPKSHPEQRLALIEETIAQHGMIAPGERVLVAFSGGPDSTATALALDGLGHAVVLGHVDHGMRHGSAEDAKSCMKIAESLGLEISVRSVTVLPSTEERARVVRYAALEEMADGAGASKIATGHTMDDDAETVVMRTDRGGFALGIPPVRGQVIRPLIRLRRRDTEAMCRVAGVFYLTDPSNRDLSLTRNRIRAELAGMTDAQIEKLVALGSDNREAARLVGGSAAELLKLARPIEDLLLLPADAVLSAEPDVLRQAIREAVMREGSEMTKGAVEHLCEKVIGKTGSPMQLAEGLWAWWEPGGLVIGDLPQDRTRPQVELGRGATAIPSWGISVTVTQVSPASISGRPDLAIVDGATISGSLVLRQWREGDRYRPLGSPGSKKLQDLFVDEKVPRRLRSSVPVIVDDLGIVWVAGFRIDDRCRVTATTEDALEIEIHSL